jgi:predicted nucleic acid-binding protein
MKYVTIDTNIFIRYFIKDVPEHFAAAQKLFTSIENGETRADVSILVINEIIWIVEHFYEIPRAKYLPNLLQLLALNKLRIKEVKKEVVVKILSFLENSSIDFTDAYLLFTTDPKTIVSFDKTLQKLAAHPSQTHFS